MQIGDRVKILSSKPYHGQFSGKTGTVTYLSGLCADRVGVSIDGQVNKNSSYGVYWFEIRHVEIIDKNESEENIMLKGYSIANIQFLDGTNTDRKYPYALYDKSINTGDIVVVKTGHHGFALAMVVDLLQENTTVKVQHERQIVARVDFSAYYNRLAQEKRLAALKQEMDAKVKELQATALYEMLAEKDPTLAAMLQEYKAITGAVTEG